MEEQNWLLIRISLLKSFFYQKEQVYLLAIDEVVESKSGHHSFGLAKFYSSCSQKTIQGVCFFALSLINISTKTSYLPHSLQVIYSEYDKKRITEKKEKTKLGGTPQGKLRTKEGKNLPKGRKAKETKENLTASFRVFKDLFASSRIC